MPFDPIYELYQAPTQNQKCRAGNNPLGWGTIVTSAILIPFHNLIFLINGYEMPIPLLQKTAPGDQNKGIICKG